MSSEMDNIYADPNMEIDSTEHFRGKRLSSILKAPRNALDDLGSGNELTQDINIKKHRKISRRVSFANTISCRVFQQDLKSNTAESTECATDARNDLLLTQGEEPEAVPCEITGMNTLLHGPIQALVQQTEWHDADNATQRTNRHDTTLIFSDENEMDVTASHTAVITRDLESNEADKTEKIDITWFLAQLNSNNGKAQTSKEFQFFSDPTDHSCPSFEQKEDATAVKKINFSEFLMSLKSNEKACDPIEGPEKENVLFVPSPVSEDVAQSLVEFVYSHEPPDTCNATQVFRGQDGGMEMTKCQASEVRAVFSGTCEAPPEQLVCADVTEAFVDDGMDMTTSHTAKVSFPFSSVGNQNLNFQKDFPSTELDNSILKGASNQHLIIQHDPQLCPDKKVVNAEGRQDPAVLRTVKQEARTVSAIPGSVSSETVFRGDKTVVFAKHADMEITGSYTDVTYNDSTKERDSSHRKAFEQPVNTRSWLAENRRPAHGDRDITRSLTSSDNPASVSYKNSALGLSSGSDERTEKVTQDHGAASANVAFDSCAESGPAGVSTSGLQHRLANSHLVSLPGEKTVIFSGEDMELTKTCVVKDDGKNVENESPAGAFTSVTCKPPFLDNRSTSLHLNEQEEMEITKCHAVVIDDQSNGINAGAKPMHCKIIPRKSQDKNVSGGASSLDVDKENFEMSSVDGNIKSSQAVEMNAKDPEVIMVDKKCGKPKFQASGPSSSAQGSCPLQEQKREVPENAGTSTCAFVASQSQKDDVPRPLPKTPLNAAVPCANDKTSKFSADRNTDITKPHPAAVDVAPVNTVQEYENNHNRNNVLSEQLQSQPFQSSGSSAVGIASQTAATERGDLKMKVNKPTVTPLAPSSSFHSSTEPAPSGMKGSKLLGINADCQNSDRQDKTRALTAVNKVLPTRVDSERDFSVGRTVSSEEGFQKPRSVGGLHLGGAEEPLLANTSELRKGSSQLPLSLEKSVVFPSGENMDLTGNCGAVIPGNTISVALSEGKAVPGYLVQGGNKTMFLTKGAMVTIDSQEQPACGGYSLVSGKKMLTMSGLKHLPFAGEKTTVFSEDDDMDITRSHTVLSDNKMILQHESSNDDVSLISGDKTCVFSYNDDMEISRLDTVAIDKSMAKAASQRVLNTAKRAGRKSLMGTTGEKTLLFSPNDENNDMEITESHTAAIGHEIISQDEGGLHSLSSAHPIKSVMGTSGRADTDMTEACSADKIAVKVVRDYKPIVDEEAGQQALPNSEATVFAVDDMEITETRQGALEENSLRGRQPHRSVPLSSTIMFTSYQADMEMTKLHSDESLERVFCEDELNLAEQAGWEAVSGSRTVVFTLAEDMEITKTHSAVLRGEGAVQDRESVPAISAVPADKTIVFAHSQDDMEITASHTIAVNNNANGFENQEVSHKSTLRPDLHGALLSSCRGEIDSSRMKDLDGEYCAKSKGKPSIPSSASSASAFPGEKGAFIGPVGTPPDSVCSASLPEKTVDVWALRDLDLPTDNSVPVSSTQDLVPPENLKSKTLSSRLPCNRPMDCSEESGELVSSVSLPVQQSDSLKGSPEARSTRRNQVLKGDSSRREDLATDFGLAGASLVPVSNKESKENEGLSAGGETPPKDLQINSEQTTQILVSDSPRDQIDPTLAPELSGILSVCSKLKNIRRKSAVPSVSETVSSDQLPKPSAQPEDTLRLGKNTGNNPNNLFYTTEQENTCLEAGAALIDANSGMALKDKYQGINVPLGIFQPKLPSRRNPSVSSMQDRNAKSSDKGEAAVPGVSVNTGETPGSNKGSRQNFSPSQFIAEEFLPVCLEEMDSNESVSSELMESACNERRKKQTSHHEKNQSEETKTSNTKRALEQEEEDLQSPKKVKKDETLEGEASQDLQVTFGTVSQSQAEVHEGEDPPNLSAKSPDCAPASTSGSLDSVKADTELTIQRSSQMESRLLTDSICEDNLWEKFQNGVITVGEFFTLLQVHVPIQKPRHSHIPASCAVSTPPTPEDLLYSQYVYRPKVHVYEEDCQALAQKIEELKPYVNVLDQLLVNVNKTLWEVMRTCSDDELKSFGAELNKMKSCFTKESKILAHNEKVTLYSKLLQSAQEQHGKLQSRIEKVDEVLKEAESCLLALGVDADWEEREGDGSDEVAGGKHLKEELESIKAQEEELQRELSDLETQNEQMLAEINQLEEETKCWQELVEKYDFTEWEITEWSQEQAVFTFLHDSIELTVVFGPPIDGDEFGEDPSRKIVSLNFESLLDDEEAPPSSCLVLRLIFQFIESQGCWQEKCPTLHYLPQVLHDVSLVVSHCKILGEEIEFLERWGGKFNLLKTNISDTRVKLLFSSSVAFAKFELTLSLSADYPSASLPSTVQKYIGNIGEEEISAVLSNVPTGHHYLRRIVSLIHQNLLQDPR